MLNLLYITSSSFSGSTLLAFLLNNHPEIFTVGENDGWDYPEGKKFYCSCGALLNECPFYRYIAAAMAVENLPFDYRSFGTKYVVTQKDNRLNHYLTGYLPLIKPHAALEKFRDKMIRNIPPWRARLDRQHQANKVFVRAALDYSGATVFVDAGKDPYRLRHLQSAREFAIKAVYLTRDPRGVVLSHMQRRGMSAQAVTTMWLREQLAIFNVLQDFPGYLPVKYEDLCDRTDAALAGIHRYVGMAPQVFSGKDKDHEHHILGNAMRLRESDEIIRDERWRRQLSAGDLKKIEQTVTAFINFYSQHPLATILSGYMMAP